MKRNKLALIALFAVLSSFGVSTASTLPEAKIRAIKETVANAPVLELAPKAAEIVRQADAKDREEVAIAVVRAVITQKRSVARDLVVAIVKVAPEVSAVVASEAARLCPDEAVLIAKDAADFAPAQAPEIAAAVAKVTPSLATRITKVAVAANPDETPKIIEAVIFSVPNSKNAIETDATLGVVNAFARNTRSSAAFNRRIVVGIPRIITLPPPTPITPSVQARSSALVSAINDMRTLDTTVPAADRGQISSLVVSAIRTFDSINANNKLSKPEKDAILLATSGTVKTVVADPDLTSTQKSDSATAATLAIQQIVKDPDLSADTAKVFVDYVAQKTTQLVTDPNTKGLALGESIKAVAGEVQKVIQAVQTITPAQAQAALAQVELKVDEVKNKYNRP